MLTGLLTAVLVVLCFMLILLVLIQKGKGGMGLGSLGGGSQMLFGGSGGQDLFQKITWALGIVFMVLSLGLALLKSHERHTSRFMKGGSGAYSSPLTQQDKADKREF